MKTVAHCLLHSKIHDVGCLSDSQTVFIVGKNFKPVVA